MLARAIPGSLHIIRKIGRLRHSKFQDSTVHCMLIKWIYCRVPENCGFTAADKSTGQPQPLTSDSPRNHRLLNSGTVVLTPSQEDYDTLIHTMNTHPAVPDMIFFDQDLLPIVYDDKWLPLPYIYNGLKTLRGCHSDLWKDNDVKILHYILQKPWKSRTIEQDVVGIQHKLWWDEYSQLESNWKAAKNTTRNLLWKEVVEPQVAPVENPLKSLTSAFARQSNPLSGKQLPSNMQIPASYRTSESVLVALIVALLFGFFLGRGTKSSVKGMYFCPEIESNEPDITSTLQSSNLEDVVLKLSTLLRTDGACSGHMTFTRYLVSLLVVVTIDQMLLKRHPRSITRV